MALYLPMIIYSLLIALIALVIIRPLLAYHREPRMWAWALNRLAGISIVLFLFIHIGEMTAMAWGADAYNEAISIYKQDWFRPFEVLLVGAVVYHGIYGLRVMLLDFWANGTRNDWRLIIGGAVAILALMGPTALIMLWPAIS